MLLNQTCPLQNGEPSIWWMDFFFSKCLYTGWSAASAVFGMGSVVLWLIALLPQIHTNWRLKSTSGLSPKFLLFWFVGDSMSLIGCLALNQKLFQLFLSSYFIVTDVVLFSQYFLYKEKESQTRDIAALTPAAMIDETSSLLTPTTRSPERAKDDGYLDQQLQEKKLWQRTSVRLSMLAAITTLCIWIAAHLWRTYRQHTRITFEAVGLFMGWVSSIFCHISRTPQLWHNYKRQSVDGLSSAMFIIIFAANGSYAASLLTLIPVAEPGFSYKSASYIYNSIGSMVLDFMVLLQFHILRRQAKHCASSSTAKSP